MASLRPGGRDFERVCKWALENVPEYRQRLRHVWLWDDWPGRWGRDAGIDLVAEDQEGGLWAVQAKHYDPAYAIKKADLDSFLSESSRPGFTYRLLIASTDHLGPTARRTLDAQEKPVGTLLRSQLEALDVAWPATVTRLRPVKPKRKRPRPHQRLALADCAAGLDKSERGQLVMACGTGKTLVAPFLAERMAAKRVLVLVPSLSLLAQTLREWATATDFDYLAVCSDDTVTKDEHDAVVASTSELGVPVTTDAARVARFLRRRGTGTKVIFSTYQSSQQIAAAQTAGVPAFDLVIADEAHRCAGPQAGVFATVLDAAKIKARKRLFMTATPRYFTGRVKREAKEANWEVASMDEVEKFGSVLHRLTFAQAIDQDLLSDYQVVVVGVTDSEAHDLAARGAFVTQDGHAVTDARTLARQLGLLRAMAKYDLRRIVTFHSRIEYATRFASSLPETRAWLPARRRPSGDLWTDHVSGKMTAGERDARLRRLRAVGSGERGVLTNARCLTEGVDVPTLDGVAFIDPRRSQVDVVQAVGRAIRKAEDKTVGTIVIPVLVDEDTDPEDALASGEFDRVWEIVRALRDHDEDLAEELDELRRGQGMRGTVSERPSKIALDLPVAVGSAFARAFDTRLVERATTSWQEGLGAARAYRAEHGDLRVPPGHVTHDGFKLRIWIDNCRGRQGRLSPAQTAELDALGMIWDPLDDQWRRGLAAAQGFHAQHGHLRVSRSMRYDGINLGLWVQTRRQEYRRGDLTRERRFELDSLGMIWDPFEDDWQQGMAAARIYCEGRGDLRVPQKYRSPEGFRLGTWIFSRRMEHKSGRLSAERVAELDALGMVWEPHEETWQRGLRSARRYHDEHGDLRIPKKHVEPDGFRLGSWLDNRRMEHRAGKLSARRIAMLEALGISWVPWESDWQQGLAAARAYAAEHGDLRTHGNYVTPDGIKLGRWLQGRRRAWRKGILPPEHCAELNELGMVWIPDERGDAWQRAYAAAAKYRASKGDLLVPQSYETADGFALGAWISNQRTLRRREELSAGRVAGLEALGMVWDALDEDWQRGISVARDFQKAQGHLRVPRSFVSADGYPLGWWITYRRHDRKRGRLAPERIKALDSLGMVWDPFGSAWEKGISHAQAYRQANGHLRAPRDFVADDGFRLGSWLHARRQDRRTGKLAVQGINELDALGMVWDPYEEAWQQGLAAARQYRAEHGDLGIPSGYVTSDGLALGSWIYNRRAEKRKGKLAPDRVAQLEALPGWTWDASKKA